MNLTLERFGRRSSAALKRGTERLKKSVLSLKWYEWLMIGIMLVVATYSVVTAFMGYNPLLSAMRGTTVKDYNPGWLSIVNFVSAVAGIMCIFLCAKASISNFIFGLVNTVVYTIYLVYWCSQGEPLWGTVGLELIVYLPTGVISWAIWARHRDQVQDELTKARKFTWWQDLLLGAGVLALTAFTHYVISLIPGVSDTGWYKIGDTYGVGSVLGWLDSAVFAIGISATLLQMFRFREQYVLWLVQDVVVVTQFTLPLFIETPKGFDPVYWTKKMIYLIMAIVGLINWCKLNKQRNTANE